MPMLKQREVIRAKVETTYNVDPGLSSTDDIMVENPSWAYEGARMFERKPSRSSLASLKSVFGGTLKQVTFEAELKGSGSAGTAPEIGALLRACGFSETVDSGVSVTYAPSSTPSTQASVTIHYYQDGHLVVLTGCKGTCNFNLETGQKGKVSFTFTGHLKMSGTAQSATATTIVLPATFSAVDDAYNGRTIKIIRGLGAGQSRTISDYTGSSKTVTVATWDTNPDNTSVFEIEGDGIDVALPTPSFDSAVPPPLIGVGFSIASYSAVISKLAFDVGNQVAMPADISSPDGFGQLMITGRDVTGSFDPEKVLAATHNFKKKWKDGDAMALATGTIGSTAGNQYAISMPAVTYTAVGPGDRDGIATYELSYQAKESSGDDELSIVFT